MVNRRNQIAHGDADAINTLADANLYVSQTERIAEVFDKLLFDESTMVSLTYRKAKALSPSAAPPPEKRTVGMTIPKSALICVRQYMQLGRPLRPGTQERDLRCERDP